MVDYSEGFNYQRGTIDFYALIREFKEEILQADGKSVGIDRIGQKPALFEDDKVDASGSFLVQTGEKNYSNLVTNEVIKYNARLWVNGKFIATYTKNDVIYYNGKPLSTVAMSEGKTSCLSYWKEGGARYASYNPDMKDSPVKLTRRDKNDINGTWKWNSKKFDADKNNYFGDDTSVFVNFDIEQLNSNDTTPHLRVKIEQEGKLIKDPITWYNINWNVSSKYRLPFDCDIALVAKFNGDYIPQLTFEMLAAHEIGHTLGLGDAYEGGWHIPLSISATRCRRDESQYFS